MKKDKPNSPDFSELRRQAEERFAAKQRESGQPPGYIEKLLHELQVHQIELELQNEELRSTHVQLQESLMEYSDLYDFAPTGYFTLNEEGLILKANLAGAALVGVERGNLIDKPLRNFIAGESRAVLDDFRKTLLKTSTKHFCEVKLLRKGNSSAYALIEGIVLEDTQEREKQCRIAVIDITDRKYAETALRCAHDELEARVRERTAELVAANQELQAEIAERKRVQEILSKSEERFRSLVMATSQIVWTTDPMGEVVDDLPTWRVFTGQSEEELKGSGWSQALHPEDRLRTAEIWKQAIKSRTIYDTEYRLRRYDGEFRHVVARGVPVLNRDGSIREWVGTCTDITESRNMEKHLSRADRLSSLGVLSGGIAHEIRNPLAGINLFIDVLSDEEKFDRTNHEQNIFKEIKLNIKKIDGIIKGVLGYAKQTETAPLTKMDVSRLVEESLKLWHSRMVKDGIQLRLSLEENLPKILADPIEVQQVITNLVQNAIEAMGNGGTLSISVENGTLSFDGKRPAVIIKVQDSGPGIPFDQQKNIFNPFFTTKHTGTGLGLALSHRIVAHQGGDISFESAADVGTTFTVELPAAPLD